MQEMLELALDYLKGIWLKRRFIMIATWLICPIGWFKIAQMEDMYKAQARVYADTETILRPLLRGLTIQTNPENQMKLMAKTLLIRPNLERIARMTDLDLSATTPAQFNSLINRLRRNIKINLSGSRGANFFTISYISKDPSIPKKVVQATLTVFIENTLGDDRQDNDSAQEFLDEQIKEYENRLSVAEAKVTAYKQKYNDILPGSKGYYGQLKSEKDRLEQSKLELKELETKLASAKQQLLTSSQQPSEISDNIEDDNRVGTVYDDRIKALDAKLDGLLLKYTEKHPEVTKTQRLQDHLKGLRKKELDAYYNSLTVNNDDAQAQGNTLSNNPIAKELQIQVNQIENEIASLKVRVKNYQDKVTKLEYVIDTVPEIEAEFTALNRDYGVIKSKYTQLLNRKETASLAQVANENTSKIEFRVLDAPSTPTRPFGPKRIPYFIAVTLLGFAAGIGLSFLFSQFNPVVTSTRQISKATGIPILGVLSATENLNLKKWHKQKTLIFIASNVGLFLLLFAFIAYSQNPELLQAPLRRIF